jgi:hypothetical protein
MNLLGGVWSASLYENLSIVFLNGEFESLIR